MLREDLVFVGTCDIAGLVRGKGFPSAELPARRKVGIGWTHSNLMQTCFGPILDTPFGTSGDLMIVPDPSSEVHVDFRDGSAPEHFFLGDIRNTDGTPWDCCVRAFLRRAIGALKDASGLELLAAFEQEFVYTGVEDVPGHAYSLSAFRRQGLFGEMLTAAIRAASVRPDSFLAEYGPRQYEMTVAPDAAMAAADAGVIAREMARAAAFRLENRAIFSPMPVADGAGNGVHIHFSLHEASGKPVTGAPDGVMGLSPVAAQFAAGVLHHLPAICAVTAPSPVSYLRLTPNRWAPTVADLKLQDRGHRHAHGVAQGHAIQMAVEHCRKDGRCAQKARTPLQHCRREVVELGDVVVEQRDMAKRLGVDLAPARIDGFDDIAKLVGNPWGHLDPDERGSNDHSTTVVQLNSVQGDAVCVPGDHA